MHFNDLLEQIETCPDDLRSYVRLDLLAGASALSAQQMEQIRSRLQNRAGLSLSEWMAALEKESFRWSEKSFRQSQRIASSSLIAGFDRRHEKDGRSSKGISLSQCKALLCRLYVLSLHELSIRLGQNCLKKRRVKELCSLFGDDGPFSSCRSFIERPILLAGKGRLLPTSDEFVFSVLVISRIVADLIRLHEDDKNVGPLFVAQETLRAVRYMDHAGLSAFLRPEGLPVHLEPCALPKQPPLEGLEPVVDPSMVLFFAQESPQQTDTADPIFSDDSDTR